MYRSWIATRGCIFQWNYSCELIYLCDVEVAFYKQLLMLLESFSLNNKQYEYHRNCMESFNRCLKLKEVINV